MPKDEFVVMSSASGVGTPQFLTGYSPGDPPSSIFGNLSDALIYDTQAEVDALADAIGGGTVGTRKP